MGAAQIRWGGSEVLGDDCARATRDLRDAIARAVLPLGLPASGPVRELRSILLNQLDDYLLPRLVEPDRPLLVVVGGPTGVGKSTIVNTLVGESVTQSGLIRPTTRSPVLVHHPDDAAWFGAGGILADFDRVDHGTDDPHLLQLVATTAVPRGVALLDAPDFDSIDEANRRLATRLLAAADMWLFVTSANRYADEVPWHQLDIARRRQTPLLVVLNRIQPEDLDVVSTDLVRQLGERGIGRGKVIIVEHGPVADGRLQTAQIGDLRRALEEISAAPALRRDIAVQCAIGALRDAGRTADRVAAAVDEQVHAVGELLRVVDVTYDAALEQLLASATDGTVLRGALLAHWHEIVGTDEPLAMADLIERVRDRGVAMAAEQQVRELAAIEIALDLAVEALVLETATRAAEATGRSLLATPVGGAMLDWSDDDLSRPGRALRSGVRPAVAAWRRSLARDAGDADHGDIASRLLAVALAVGTLCRPGAVPSADAGLQALLHDLMSLERRRYLQPVMTWGLTPGAAHDVRTARRVVAGFVEVQVERKASA